MPDDPSQEKNAPREYFNQLIQFEYMITNLNYATFYLDALESIVNIKKSSASVKKMSLYFHLPDQVEESMATRLSQLAKKYIQRDWSATSVGTTKAKVKATIRYKTSDLQYFVQLYLRHAAMPLDAVESLCLEGIEKLLERRGEVSPPLYPTLTSVSFILYYRPMLELIVHCISRLDFQPGANQPAFLVAFMTHSTMLFKLMVLITKSFQKPQIIATVLKQGRLLLESIISAMPFFERHFVEFNAEVADLFKDLQIITRRMQTLCAHGKVMIYERSISTSHLLTFTP